MCLCIKTQRDLLLQYNEMFTYLEFCFCFSQCLKMLNNWAPDIFQITEVTHNRPLTVVVYSILKVCIILCSFLPTIQEFWVFFLRIACYYRCHAVLEPCANHAMLCYLLTSFYLEYDYWDGLIMFRRLSRYLPSLPPPILGFRHADTSDLMVCAPPTFQ